MAIHPFVCSLVGLLIHSVIYANTHSPGGGSPGLKTLGKFVGKTKEKKFPFSLEFFFQLIKKPTKFTVSTPKIAMFIPKTQT